MGWFWGSFNDNKNDKDTLRDLDPSLREFLKKEAPVKYEPTSKPAPPKQNTPVAPKPQVDENASTGVPSQSLYKDGRYSDLWKTYRPQSQIESEGKSEQEKMMDVLEGYKSRRAEIGRIALENCALEQLEVNDCFRQGGWSAMTSMCKEEDRRFNRCYMMQAQFLKALGYLSTNDRSPEVDEKIQMHADTLYHRMLDQEKAIEKAKEEGKPIPAFPSILPEAREHANGSKSKAPEIKASTEISELPEKLQAPVNKRLDTFEGERREIEEKAMEAEIEAGSQVAGRLADMNRKQEAERKIRKEQGRETLADKVFYSFRAK